MVHTVTHRRNETMQSCIDACTNCHAVCAETLSHCLEQGGKHVEAAHVRLMLDCIEICDQSARFMIRESRYSAETCKACATICRACAESCDAITPSDDMMKRCAETCRECAEECETMSSAA